MQKYANIGRLICAENLSAACERTSKHRHLAVPVPGRQHQVPQRQVHGGISGELGELVQLVQLHHVGSDTQGFPTLVRLIEGLEIGRESRDYTHIHTQANICSINKAKQVNRVNMRTNVYQHTRFVLWMLFIMKYDDPHDWFVLQGHI